MLSNRLLQAQLQPLDATWLNARNLFPTTIVIVLGATVATQLIKSLRGVTRTTPISKGICQFIKVLQCRTQTVQQLVVVINTLEDKMMLSAFVGTLMDLKGGQQKIPVTVIMNGILQYLPMQTWDPVLTVCTPQQIVRIVFTNGKHTPIRTVVGMLVASAPVFLLEMQRQSALRWGKMCAKL